MNFEAIETAFELLLENVQTIENDLGTHAYDALIEQNSYYLGAEVANLIMKKTTMHLLSKIPIIWGLRLLII